MSPGQGKACIANGGQFVLTVVPWMDVASGSDCEGCVSERDSAHSQEDGRG